jgi:glutathione S-transferase
MKLYGSLTSPFVRKLRVLIKEKGLPCEFTVADPAAADGPVRRLNPLWQVPVLERDGAEPLYDSPVILEYLDGLAAPALIPAGGEARWQALRAQALADGIMEAVIARLLELRRPPAQRSAEAIAFQEARVAAALAHAATLPRGEAYFGGERFGLADLALGVALEYADFRYPHDWRARHPRLALWLAGIGTRPAFAETCPPGMDRPTQTPH